MVIGGSGLLPTPVEYVHQAKLVGVQGKLTRYLHTACESVIKRRGAIFWLQASEHLLDARHDLRYQ